MLNILFEDKEILVCEKPAGIPSQSDKTGDKDMLTIVSAYIGEEAFLIHRLDRGVGGVQVFAKTKQSASNLYQQIQDNKINKNYLAVCNCSELMPLNTNTQLINYLLKNQRLNISKVVNKNTPNSKKAILTYKVVHGLFNDKLGDICLLNIELLTGRHHQIRVQLAHADMPILGDSKYNREYIRKRVPFEIALFAYQLSFMHPKTGNQVAFEIIPTAYPFNLF